MIAGLGTPAFADNTMPGDNGEQITGITETINSPSLADPEDVVYENGEPDSSTGRFIDFIATANDFVLSEDTKITDVHFAMQFVESGEFTEQIEYFILSDDGGTPGDIMAFGVILNPDTEANGVGNFGDRFLVWFDLIEPVELSGGVTYWLALHAGDELETLPSHPFWEKSSVVIGNGGFISNVEPFEWHGEAFDNWFQITAKNGEVVGGEFLPIDSTALVLAGLQTSAIWMLPVLAGAAGAGTYYIKTRMNKE